MAMHEEEEMDNIFVLDLDYEFDANTFFDFSHPESISDAQLSESWFNSALSCPPSPSTIKFKWREEMHDENAKASLDLNPSISQLNGDREGPRSNDELSPVTPKTKTKTIMKPGSRSSTLMKPTASHLAKIKPANEIYHSRSLGRTPSSLTELSERSSKSSPLSVYQDATKRQKLEIGYLLKVQKTLSREVTRLKHIKQLLHKLSKVPGVVANVNSRPTATIPREPNLETAHRAQRHRSRNNSETYVNSNLKPPASKTQPMKQRILKASSSSLQQKCEEQSPKFQSRKKNLFHKPMGRMGHPQRPNAQNSESISVDGITDTERLNSRHAPNQEKSRPANITSVRHLSKQKLKHPVENISSCNPPTELFKKLSLKSEVDHWATCWSKDQSKNKVPKENVPSSFRREKSDRREQNHSGRKVEGIHT